MTILNNSAVTAVKTLLEELEKDKDLNLKQVDDYLYLVDEYSDEVTHIMVETTAKGWEIYQPDEPLYLNEL